jgi:hypothetical protein
MIFIFELLSTNNALTFIEINNYHFIVFSQNMETVNLNQKITDQEKCANLLQSNKKMLVAAK